MVTKKRDTKQQPPATNDVFVHYLRARDQLAERLGATPVEIALWTWIGVDFKGDAAEGLNAYRDPKLHAGRPPRFQFEESWGTDFVYLPHLMACYYRSDDLRVFEPRERYLSFDRVVARFSRFSSVDEAAALLREKALSGQLTSFHPRAGGTSGTKAWVDEPGVPSLEEGVFPNSEVLEIEEECTGVAAKNRSKDPVAGFVSLPKLLEGCWDLPLGELARAQREAVVSTFDVHWDRLSEDQRQSMAQQLDYRTDPKREEERQHDWHEMVSGWHFWRRMPTLTASEFIALRHCHDPRKVDAAKESFPNGKQPALGQRLDDDLRRVAADPSISKRERLSLNAWMRWASAAGLECPAFMHAQVREDSTTAHQGAGPAITPKAFIAKHAQFIKGGKRFLDKWFKGQTRGKGERPAAVPYRLKRGLYDEAAMISALKESGVYSELGH